jgi:hypothetical protein
MNFKFVEALKRFIDFNFNVSTVFEILPRRCRSDEFSVPFSERVDDRCRGI